MIRQILNVSLLFFFSLAYKHFHMHLFERQKTGSLRNYRKYIGVMLTKDF